MRPILRTEQRTSQLLAASWLIGRISDDVLNTNWERLQEEEADLFATDMLATLEVAPAAMAEVLRLMVEVQGAELAYLVELEDERARLTEEVEVEAAERLGRLDLGGVMEAGMSKAMEFGTYAATEAYDRMIRSHPSPDVRMGWAIDY